jgi:hypothetical protein
MIFKKILDKKTAKTLKSILAVKKNIFKYYGILRLESVNYS